jgi:cytochrome b6-f complex iron-sulfur subunit
MGGPVLASCHGRPPHPASTPAAGTLATVDVRQLAADGDWLVPAVTGPDGAPVLIVRESATTYLALSMQCTHEGCPVNQPVQRVMTCPCHGSQFDLSGQVRHGPAQFPLGHYGTTFDPKTKRLTVTLS